MPDLWLPGVTRLPDVPANALDVGLNLDNSTHRIHDWHTFESKGYATSALTGARYLNSSGKWAHFVWNPVLGGLVQLLPMNVGAWLLRVRDVDGDGDLDHTNGWGAVHAGTEVIGDAARPFTLDMTRAGQDDLIRMMNFLRSWGIPDQWAFSDPPPPYPGPGIRRRNPERSGHGFHSAYPGNDHGDPGQILAPWIAEKITVVTPPVEEPSMRYPARSSKTFWYDLPKRLRHEGYEIYDDPTFVDRGYCYFGSPTHKHSAGSLHFGREAIDFGRDPSSRVSVSQYEQAYVDAKMLMLRDFYNIGGVWRRGPNDHMDHGHLEDSAWWQVNYSGYKVEGIILYGEVSDRVRAWQQDLVKAGHKVTVDGIFRLGTFWATLAWQVSRGLLDDGIIGGGSQREMDKHLAELAAPKPIDWADLYKNYTTEMVKAAQFVLHDLGYAVGVIDGIPGPKFNAAVKEAQTDYGITPVDGFPGPVTMDALREALAALEDPEPDPAPGPDPAPRPDPEPEVPPTGILTVRRLAGRNRYETSALIDEQRGFGFNPYKVYLAATGTDDLSLAPGDGRVLSTSPTTLPSDVRNRLEELRVEELVIIGGPGAISTTVEAAATKAARA